MDKFDAMCILIAVADGGSLSSAARALNIPLATVSRKLAELELHLKVKLVHRTTRALEFTDEGLSYAAHCRKIIDEVHEAERRVAGEYAAPKGVLSLTAPVVFGRIHLVPHLAEFLKKFPEVDVQLLLTDRSVDLLEEKVDAAIRVGYLESSGLMAQKVGQLRQVTCASPAYLKKYGTPRLPKELSSHQCITISTLDSPTSWVYFAEKNAILAPTLHSRLQVSTSEAGVEAAVLGVGVVRALSYQVGPHLKNRKLELLLRGYESKPWPVNIVHQRGRIVPLKLRAFLDFIAPRLKKELAEIDEAFV